ncbi:Dbl homology domain-containing protein [Radiomyces spectabilis]|uniref:Dbl homology domain-containing protein n=1 Tax=Radiomyces spectabilis TaxID=64574 RepID=UPI0022208A65|nr:Dbl homology domain-containing protein [Radiomyces spectabilis]KAI8374661.1 Dbl homology domain-containing protein [Radiomyces spectabilis]
MAKFECYRKYLMEHGEAQKLHGKEFKSNQNYRRLLLKAQDHPQFKKRRLEDIIVEPVQRISRYSMMLKDLLRLTPKSHPDFEGLTTAYKKSQEIASMADDHPTKLATMFLNMYSIIKDSPCSLINQNRALIAHLDALEIHRTSNRVTRAVTLFLFTDKIMIASRPSMECKGSDLCALADTDIITSKKLERVIRKDSCWKFKGWADIEQVEIFGGTSGRFCFVDLSGFFFLIFGVFISSCGTLILPLSPTGIFPITRFIRSTTAWV